MKVAILTTPNQWFVSYAQTFAANIGCPLFFKHEDIGSEYDTVFVLSYHRIIGEQFLSQHKHNLVQIEFVGKRGIYTNHWER